MAAKKKARKRVTAVVTEPTNANVGADDWGRVLRARAAGKRPSRAARKVVARTVARKRRRAK